jgi:hypothetical protein
LARRPEVKRPLGRLGCRWEDTIRMELAEIGWEILEWMHVAEKRDKWRALVNAVMKFQVP